MHEKKILLSEREIPTEWYNVLADLPEPLAPPLHPGTGKPIAPSDLAPLFPAALIEQEMSPARYIDIPDEVRRVYQLWRPTPLVRAFELERALETPARIYYKNESVSPAGSHKPNTAVAQAYYNKREGVARLSTETGAGQWGSALAFACNVFGLKCLVYMVRVSYEQKPFRRSLMHTWGAEVLASPTDTTNAGRKIRAAYPDCAGTLGIAISEAVEDAATREDTKYTLGSVLNHVMLHQTVIGLEALKQMAVAHDYPDVVIACVGGGSNFAGLAFPFMPDVLSGKRRTRFVAAEPAACPSLTKGRYTYDYGDTVGLTPLLKMHTLGHNFMPARIHAGGLRYHGGAPTVSALVDHKVIEAVAYAQNPVFGAAALFARAEGIIPAPESAHAIRAAIDEALRCRATREEKCILFNLSGHGHFDLAAYDRYYEGRLEDYEHPDEEIARNLSEIEAMKLAAR